MNLPKVVADLVSAQDNFDSFAYTNCFSQTATVVDEGKTYKGRTKIQDWASETNAKYKTVMQPIEYTGTGATSVLTANISGNFDGSPVVLKYHFEIKDGLIQSLKITG